MLMVNVLPFVVLAVLVVGAEPSNEDSESDGTWKRDRRTADVGSQFFVGGSRPMNLPGVDKTDVKQKEIVQTVDNDPTPYFVSLFDFNRNIPFYSAYTVTSANSKKGKDPNVATLKKNIKWRNPVLSLDDSYSAVFEIVKDKVGAQLTRGHLNPAGINDFSAKFWKATYTLSNAAPQYKELNEGQWVNFETLVRNYAKKCGNTDRQGTLYLLSGTSNTGLEPGTSTTDPVQKRINLPHDKVDWKTYINDNLPFIPRAFWIAGCCLWEEPRWSSWPRLSRLFPSVQRAESFATMANNHNDKNFFHQVQMRVSILQTLLTKPNAASVSLFPGNGGICGQNHIELK